MTLFSQLPAPSVSLLGTKISTADKGLCYCSGTEWLPVDNNFGQNTGPSYQITASATLKHAVYVRIGENAIPGYISGVTNNINLTPAKGGTTITDFDCSGMTEGFTFFVHNESESESLTFPHAAKDASYPFKLANATSAVIAPQDSAHFTYKFGRIRFV